MIEKLRILWLGLPEHSRQLAKNFLYVALSVFVVWLIFGVGFALVFPKAGDKLPFENVATFGDSVGFVNSLFSGLAFGGVIIAIILQSFELQEQRKELRKTVKAQQDNVRLNALTTLLGYYDKEITSERSELHERQLKFHMDYAKGNVANTLKFRRAKKMSELDAMYIRAASSGKDAPEPFDLTVEGYKLWYWKSQFFKCYYNYNIDGLYNESFINELEWLLRSFSHLSYENDNLHTILKAIIYHIDITKCNSREVSLQLMEQMNAMCRHCNQIELSDDYDLYCN